MVTRSRRTSTFTVGPLPPFAFIRLFPFPKKSPYGANVPCIPWRKWLLASPPPFTLRGWPLCPLYVHLQKEFCQIITVYRDGRLTLRPHRVTLGGTRVVPFSIVDWVAWNNCSTPASRLSLSDPQWNITILTYTEFVMVFDIFSITAS